METSYSSMQTPMEAQQRGLGASVGSESSLPNSPALERAAVDAFVPSSARCVRTWVGSWRGITLTLTLALTLTLTLTR